MSTAIIGGGVSGLSFALRASRLTSSKLKVYETRSKCGGWVETTRTDSGATFEMGPRSVRFAKSPESRWTVSLMDELGLGGELIGRDKDHPAAKYRYLFVDGKVQQLPYDLKSAMSRLPFMKRSLLIDGALGMVKNINVKSSDSVYDVVEKRFGSDMAMYMVDAVTRGIFATSARNLCIDNALPSIAFLQSGRAITNLMEGRGANTYPDLIPYRPKRVKKAEMDGWKAWNLENGLESMVLQMVEQCGHRGVDINCNATIDTISKSSNTILVNDTEYDHVVTAIPAVNLHKILSDGFNAELHDNLSQYRETHLHVYLVELAEHEHPAQIGFGVLAPSCAEPDLLGITFDSCVFDEHDSPRGGSRYTIMSLAELDPGQTLKRTLGIESTISWCKHYPASIPLYDATHLRINQRTKELATQEGLTLIGNSFNGVAVNNCIYKSMLEAEKLFAVKHTPERLLAMKWT